ncbi:unnamed protein product [Pylaiella littoralis]
MSHDHGSHSSMTSMSDMSGMSDASAASSMMEAEELFCTGTGAVMLHGGFQAAVTDSVSCVLFLFEGAVVDSKTKYAFAAIGVFLMGFAVEMIRYGRDRMAKSLDVSVASDLKSASAFCVQMLLAYMLMLLVMLYEYVFLIMILLGLTTGYLTTLRLSAPRRRAALNNGAKTPPEFSGGSGAPCCNTATNA